MLQLVATFLWGVYKGVSVEGLLHFISRHYIKVVLFRGIKGALYPVTIWSSTLFIKRAEQRGLTSYFKAGIRWVFKEIIRAAFVATPPPSLNSSCGSVQISLRKASVSSPLGCNEEEIFHARPVNKQLLVRQSERVKWVNSLSFIKETNVFEGGKVLDRGPETRIMRAVRVRVACCSQSPSNLAWLC